ncbi:MAG: HlyD family efflux transporter periplasmic adaptor subunit [Gemmatimonadales bacterium]|jgi:multidrug efflux pump subunit AcrA (membrane-fusion protein)
MDIARKPPNRKKKRIIYALVGLGIIVLVTVALSRLSPAAPSVDLSTQVIDSVRRGPMLREVRGPGKLTPESPLYISAVTSGRVDRVLLRPGAIVQKGTPLLEMSNPDVELQLLSADQAVSAAQGALVTLRTSLETQRLSQQATVAQANADFRDAQRNAVAAESLAQRHLIASFDLTKARDQVENQRSRLDIEQQRLAVMSSTVDSQIALQRDQVQRLQAIAQFQRNRVASMTVTAGAAGTLQDLDLEVGQWVQAGQQLAQIVQPGHLKAVLQIPETQAAEVSPGQTASVDTRNGIVNGRVVRMDPQATNGTVSVDIAIVDSLPPGARPDLSVEGTIEIERLANVLHVGRPAYGQANSPVGLFKLVEGGHYAVRVTVQLGRASVSDVEVVSGLKEGDKVILSDMSRWDTVDRVKLN